MLNLREVIILIVSALVLVSAVSAVDVSDPQYSDLPPPPTKPERFTSKQQLKEYLVKLHEYYAIIGRPRFGRSLGAFERGFMSSLEQRSLDKTIPLKYLIDTIDQDGDGQISREEFINFITPMQGH